MKFTRRSALRMAFASVAASFVGTKAEANTKQIVRLNKIKVGGTFPFQLANGAPALLFRTKTGVFAYQTICTHQRESWTQYCRLAFVIGLIPARVVLR